MRITATAFVLALTLLASTLGAATAAAVDSFFDVFTELPVFGPPYPTAEIVTVVGTNFGGSFSASQEVRHKDWIEKQIMTSSHMVGHDGGGGAGSPGIDSFFDVFVDFDYPQMETGRRISDIHIVHPPGTPPGTWKLVPINPGAPPGSVDSFFDVFVSASFFDITYRVADDTGEHTFHHHEMSPSGRASFFDVFVELGNPVPDAAGRVDSFFDIFVDFQITGPQQLGVPDFQSRTSGTFEDNATPANANTWGTIKRLYR